MKLAPIPLVIAAALGFLLGLWLGRGHAANPVIIARADTVLVQGPPAKAARDTIRVRITHIIADTARIAALEARSDSALQALASAETAADSVPGLVVAVHFLQAALSDQRQRFAQLVTADSAYHTSAEARIGALETTLAGTVKELKRAKVHGPCDIGTVSGGVNLNGKAGLLLGGSCRVLPLLKAVF